MKETIYKIIDFITGGKGLTKSINGYKVTFPARYVNYFPSDYEAENFSFLEANVTAGNTVLDIGAHIGLFSVIAAKLSFPTGKVFAIEASGDTFHLLKETVRINKQEGRISIRKAAIGAADGTVKFYVSSVKGDNSNSVISYKEDRELNAVEVDMYSIDTLVEAEKISDLTFIKIDVEGAEFDALKGAVRTLEKFMPAIILAIHPEPIKSKGDSLGNIYDFIIDNGYRPLHNQKIISRTDFISNTQLLDLHLLPKK